MRYLRANREGGIGFATVVLLPLVLSGCFSRAPVSNEPRHIGDVIEATGSPFVIRRNENYIIDVQSRIYEGDIIETNDSSKAQIEMNDRSMIRIGPDSHFVFNRYDYAPGVSAPVAQMTFTEGSVRIEMHDIALARRPTFEIKTPFAIVGAGAGEFWAGFIFAANTLDVATLAGKGIDVTNDHGTVRLDAPGYGTTITAGGAPQVPMQWAKAKLSQAIDATRLKD